ncbi:MAG TPA: dihydroorotate dehydrogenase electron transfer subunit [Euzebyales bacterium]|nr:dihydroorotate dehydrogenase electron transfer subunit [Euzebyales bacterium]
MTATAEPAMSAPVATTGTLVARRAAGIYHVLTIAAPDIVDAAVPGQFVSVGVGAPGTLLRRPFAIAGVDRAAGLLDLVIAVVGRGSTWLVERPMSTTLDLTGPLGTGFAVPGEPTRCLLVGGGYGVAALVWLAGRLVGVGHTVEVLSGARSATALYPVAQEDALTLHEVGSRDRPPTLHEVTEDGSRGRRGVVTDVLVDRLAAGGDAALFACGPMAMLAAVARVAEARGTSCQVAVEEHMGCSVGVCMTCVVPAGRSYLRACIDGPVLDATRVDWASALDRHPGPPLSPATPGSSRQRGPS